MVLPVNSTLHGGQYKIVRFINAGGFGCTYEAYDTLMETRVAIKEFFVKDYCNRDEATSKITLATQSKRELVGKLRQKFIEEARALFKMKHDNIVRVFNIFEENDTAYYVMEYVDGLSLNDILKKRGSLSESEMLSYIRQVAAALKYVHQQNRLHLDVKPGNILVDNTGKAVLIDFGASKHYDEGTGKNTTTMQGLNTPGYAPYEQTVEGITEFTPASDIYALGATMYKLLTGVTPPNSGLLFLRRKTLAPLPESISTVTRYAVTAAMQLHEEDRPQSIDEFLLLLDAKAEGDKVDEDEDEEVTVIVESEQEHKANAKQDGTKVSKPEKPINGYENGHEWVDLGLSVKWATCNVGAGKPEESGNYFAWGEISATDDYSERYYAWVTVSWWKGATITKYCAADGKTQLDSSDDAAHVNWGGSWRMPTKAEQDELREKCTWTWTTLNGIQGYKVTSKSNGNSIFLPATGYIVYSGFRNVTSGYYWSSSLCESGPDHAYELYFNSSYVNAYDINRYYGQSVRAVCP